MTPWPIIAHDARRWADLWPDWSTPDVDGYPSTTPGNGSQGVGGGGIGRPTESAVLRRERHQDDVRRAGMHAVNLWTLTHACLTALSRPITLAPVPPAMLHVRALSRTAIGADLVARLTAPPCTLPTVPTDDQGETVVLTWLEVEEAVTAQHTALRRIMPRDATDTTAEAKAARCEDPVCELLAVRAGRCWHHYRILLAEERRAG